MGKKLDLYIKGRFTKSKTKDWIEVLNPATQEVLCLAPCATHSEIDDAVQAAKEAFHEWGETPPPERARRAPSSRA